MRPEIAAAVAFLAAATTGADPRITDFQDFPPFLDKYGYYSKLHLWDHYIIPVCWENISDTSIDDRLIVERAIETTWGNRELARLQFVRWADQCSDHQPGIHIRVADEQPHALIGNRLDQANNGLILNFSFKKWIPTNYCLSHHADCIATIAVHEFGHAVGFVHESLRSDAPAACKAKKDVMIDATDLTSNVHDATPIATYDSDSIMNYCTAIYGRGFLLSDNDKRAYLTMYDKEPL